MPQVQHRTERSHRERPYEIEFRGVACRGTPGSELRGRPCSTHKTKARNASISQRRVPWLFESASMIEIPTYGGYPAPRTTSPISPARETIIEPGRLKGGNQGTPTLSAFHLKPSRKLSRPWPKKPLRKLRLVEGWPPTHTCGLRPSHFPILGKTF